MDTRIVPADPAGIVRAAALIREGAVVACPSETVYGLCGDATDGAAVARIYQAKGRPSFNPLIVHVADGAAARAIGVFGAIEDALAAHFWPGPLTLVVPLRPDARVAALATAGLPTVALRVPAHPAMQALIAASDRPLAAPSANASGRISPTRADHVRRSLDGRIPLILDGGATAHGLESTIVAVTDGALRLLRPGPIDAAMLAAATGLTPTAPHGRSIQAPGQLAGHYAPSKPLRLNAIAARGGEWLIGFGPVAGDASLSPSGDLVEAAARLFDLLHQADAGPAPAIAVAPLPTGGLGAAIADRLGRAAHGADRAGPAMRG